LDDSWGFTVPDVAVELDREGLVIPILNTAEMRAQDARAVAQRGTDSLVAAAGTAVALQAKQMLGSCYGARVAVVVGPGLNGADGRVAARWLRSRGARVDEIEVAHQPASLDGYGLVIDAAFGLGCSRPYFAPAVPAGTAVLAVDLPSGVESDSGAVLGSPLHADVTLAIGALKPAHLEGPASAFTGELRFAGLDIVQEFRDGVIEDSDLDRLIRGRRDDHKWIHAVQVYAGSTLMPGAAGLVVRGALAGGASMIRLESRGDASSALDLPLEVVRTVGEPFDQRCRCVVAGPGLGADAASWLGKRLEEVEVPVVLDADGLDRALLHAEAVPQRQWVLTPHEGEFARLTGQPVGSNRFEAVRDLARETGCVVLLKGSTTVVASPEGTLRVVCSGTAALATAGTGDVLAGLIGATIARGHDPLEAAALAAHLHGRAGSRMATYAGASQLLASVAEILGEHHASEPGQ
jgi:NAD(P)H-hydrate epimerase